ncbi:MAG: hypothetical protein K5694_05660 [Bacilli bacterium]|nr:hypothetical protein [Bacilli bacterium]
MKRGIIGAVLAAGVASVAGVSAIAVGNVNLATVNATTAQTTRRIWIINNTYTEGNQGWYKWIHIGVWDATNSKWYATSEALGSDYYRGLVFADLPTTCTKIVVHGGETAAAAITWGTDENAGWKSADITLDTWGTTTGDVYKFDTIYEKDLARGYDNSIRTAGLGQSQLEYLLSFYDTCATDYASGYNSYKQLYYNFLKPTDKSFISAATVNKANKEPGTGVSAVTKLTRMKANAEADQGISLPDFLS